MTKQPRGLGKGLSALLGDGDLTQIRKPVEYINKSVSTEEPRSGAEIMLCSGGTCRLNPYTRTDTACDRPQEKCGQIPDHQRRETVQGLPDGRDAGDTCLYP